MIVSLFKKQGFEHGYDAEIGLWYVVLPQLSITLYFDAPNQSAASSLFARVCRFFNVNQGVQS